MAGPITPEGTALAPKIIRQRSERIDGSLSEVSRKEAGPLPDSIRVVPVSDLRTIVAPTKTSERGATENVSGNLYVAKMPDGTLILAHLGNAQSSRPRIVPSAKGELSISAGLAGLNETGVLTINVPTDGSANVTATLDKVSCPAPAFSDSTRPTQCSTIAISDSGQAVGVNMQFVPSARGAYETGSIFSLKSPVSGPELRSLYQYYPGERLSRRGEYLTPRDIANDGTVLLYQIDPHGERALLNSSRMTRAISVEGVSAADARVFSRDGSMAIVDIEQERQGSAVVEISNGRAIKSYSLSVPKNVQFDGTVPELQGATGIVKGHYAQGFADRGEGTSLQPSVKDSRPLIFGAAEVEYTNAEGKSAFLVRSVSWKFDEATSTYQFQGFAPLTDRRHAILVPEESQTALTLPQIGTITLHGATKYPDGIFGQRKAATAITVDGVSKSGDFNAFLNENYLSVPMESLSSRIGLRQINGHTIITGGGVRSGLTYYIITPAKQFDERLRDYFELSR